MKWADQNIPADQGITWSRTVHYTVIMRHKKTDEKLVFDYQCIRDIRLVARIFTERYPAYRLLKVDEGEWSWHPIEG